jgi:drug/metabolite transporter (DMT)-like permease
MTSSLASRGALYMIASAFGFSIMSVLVKVASEAGLPTGELVLARAVVTLIVSYAMVVRGGHHPWGNNRGKLILRGVVGFGGLTCYYGSIAHLPLADATTIQNTTPVITSLLAWWVLKESVGWAAAFAIACGIGGVTLIVHPSGVGVDPIGLVFGVGACCCSALAYVTVRQLAKTEHPLVIVFYFPLVALPLSIPWAVYDWVWPSPAEWVLLVAIGLATQVGQVFLTMGLMIERAGKATSMGYIQVVFAMIWQTVLFDSPPELASIGGAALIVVGTLAVTRRDAAASPGSPPTSSARPS